MSAKPGSCHDNVREQCASVWKSDCKRRKKIETKPGRIRRRAASSSAWSTTICSLTATATVGGASTTFGRLSLRQCLRASTKASAQSSERDENAERNERNDDQLNPRHAPLCLWKHFFLTSAFSLHNFKTKIKFCFLCVIFLLPITRRHDFDWRDAVLFDDVSLHLFPLADERASCALGRQCAALVLMSTAFADRRHTHRTILTMNITFKVNVQNYTRARTLPGKRRACADSNRVDER